MNFLASINQNNILFDDSKNTIKKLIITTLAFDIIGKEFQDKKEEWRMIGKKVTKWLKQTKEDISKL